MLRTVTFAPKTNTINTPPGVLDMIANEEIASVSDGLSDFVPFLSNVTGSNGVYKGDLNLFVFREHFKQSLVTAVNGHKLCNGTFTGVSLQGGTIASGSCLVDFGGDMGGSVSTVQSDVEFIGDFSTEEFGTDTSNHALHHAGREEEANRLFSFPAVFTFYNFLVTRENSVPSVGYRSHHLRSPPKNPCLHPLVADRDEPRRMRPADRALKIAASPASPIKKRCPFVLR